MTVATTTERVEPRFIDEEMRESFLDYAMSVIVQRALPDVRDGLKPVHRRILYSMYELGLRPDRPYKKAATVVGDVLGKYHPHGDSAVYDALVRMVQEFSLRYPLVDGQGNFGSIDGDSAAAYRYTEARLSPVALEVLAEIEEDTVDFAPNFDDRLEEPKVLPSRLPNLLVNGSSGIAVGMSTNIPPHNLGEIGRAVIHLLDHPECTLDELMSFVPGPDFPTGGLIVGRKGIRDAYETGRGRVIMRARMLRERRRGGREQLVVTEIPYATNKTRIIEQIATLSRKGKIPDVSDLRDESDRDGLRLVLDLKRGADAAAIAKALHRWTSLQSTFGVIALALDDGVPREMPLKVLLERYRDHRIEVVVRRSEWRLRRAREESHVLEGLLIALENIDEVVRIIKGSRTRESAGKKLRKEFALTEPQAEAVLRMRLSRLTSLETGQLRRRHEELRREIGELEGILESPERQVALVRAELEEVVSRYADPRRTTILDSDEVSLEALVADESVIVVMTRQGYAKQMPMSLYERRLREGRPLADMERFEGDSLQRVFMARMQDIVLVFTRGGQAYGLAVEDLPEPGRSSRGSAVHELVGMEGDEEVAAVLPLRDPGEGAMLVFVTRGGVVKRMELSPIANPRSGGIRALSLSGGDALLDVRPVGDGDDIVLVTAAGRLIRFPADEVSSMGRTARGVRGIRLREGDEVVGLAVARRDGQLCLVSARGRAARLSLSEISSQGRGGLGSALSVADDGDRLVAAFEVGGGEQLMAVASGGRMHTLSVREVPVAASGADDAPIIPLAGEERVVSVSRLAKGGSRPPAAAEEETPEEGEDSPVSEAEADDEESAGNDEVTGEEQLSMEVD